MATVHRLLMVLLVVALAGAALVPAVDTARAAPGAQAAPAADGVWTPLLPSAPLGGRWNHAAVWTGSEMIVWGGAGEGGLTADGAAYDPARGQWRLLAGDSPLAPREGHSAVWTGSEMLVWGGACGEGCLLGDGAAYNPATGAWRPITTAGAPSPRADHVAFWARSRMFVCNGRTQDDEGTGCFAYDPAADAWAPADERMSPSLWQHYGHSAVYTDDEVLFWGGLDHLVDGFAYRYNLTSGIMTPLIRTGAPSPRLDHTAVWTGTEMLLWGGRALVSGGPGGPLAAAALGDGAAYDPPANLWRPLPVAGAPAPRWGHSAVWTGSEMLVWGGRNEAGPVTTAAVYTPPAQLTPRDERYFPQTGFRVDDDTIWDYFAHRGGVETFGYPISRKFRFLGFETQLFQRRAVQLDEQGRARLLNILDPGLLPYTSFNGARVPGYDAALVATAPDPADSRSVLAWVEENAPQVFDGKPVGFYRTFLDTVSLEAAGPDPSFLPGFALEMWGVPTSRPMLDPNNHEFVYLRFQRGIMMYDAATGLTQGVLLGDMLRSIITGEGTPYDLVEAAHTGPLYRQYDPGRPLWLRDPALLPGTDLTNAFARQ